MPNSSYITSRRKRIKFRAWHRGIREMDLILGHYIDAHINEMTSKEMDEFEQIMSHEDRDLLHFIMGKSTLPELDNFPILRHIVHYTQKSSTNFT